MMLVTMGETIQQLKTIIDWMLKFRSRADKSRREFNLAISLTRTTWFLAIRYTKSLKLVVCITGGGTVYIYNKTDILAGKIQLSVMCTAGLATQGRMYFPCYSRSRIRYHFWMVYSKGRFYDHAGFHACFNLLEDLDKQRVYLLEEIDKQHASSTLPCWSSPCTVLYHR